MSVEAIDLNYEKRLGIVYEELSRKSMDELVDHFLEVSYAAQRIIRDYVEQQPQTFQNEFWGLEAAFSSAS